VTVELQGRSEDFEQDSGDTENYGLTKGLSITAWVCSALLMTSLPPPPLANRRDMCSGVMVIITNRTSLSKNLNEKSVIYASAAIYTMIGSVPLYLFTPFTQLA
jgi:hypothetical protein